MKGLLLNDFLTMRKVIGLYAVILVIYYCFGIFGSSSGSIQAFAVFFSAMLVIYSFSYEEKSRWDRYVNVLPVSRGQVVLAKYLLAVICMCVAFLAGILVQLGTNMIKKLPLLTGFWAPAAAVAVALLFLGIVIPILFRFGAEKSRMILILIFLIPFAGALLLEKAGIQFTFGTETIRQLAPFAAAGLLVFLFISYLLAVRIYKRKEF